MMRMKILLPFFLICMTASFVFSAETKSNLEPTIDNGKWFFLKAVDTTAGEHHTKHAEIFGKYVTGYNYYVLEGIDKAQSHAMDGGGYFIGVKAVPAESPIGYELK